MDKKRSKNAYIAGNCAKIGKKRSNFWPKTHIQGQLCTLFGKSELSRPELHRDRKMQKTIKKVSKKAYIGTKIVKKHAKKDRKTHIQQKYGHFCTFSQTQAALDEAPSPRLHPKLNPNPTKQTQAILEIAGIYPRDPPTIRDLQVPKGDPVS